MLSTPLTTDDRFDKVDAQLSEINKQLDRVATVVVKGFDRIDKALEEKASNADMQRVLGLLDGLLNDKKYLMTKD